VRDSCTDTLIQLHDECRRLTATAHVIEICTENSTPATTPTPRGHRAARCRAGARTPAIATHRQTNQGAPPGLPLVHVCRVPTHSVTRLREHAALPAKPWLSHPDARDVECGAHYIRPPPCEMAEVGTVNLFTQGSGDAATQRVQRYATVLRHIAYRLTADRPVRSASIALGL
jgi:hypothetical protein